MHHTLNQRHTYAKAIHEQKPIEEELSWGHTGTQEKLPSPPDERRWPTLTEDWESLINDEEAWKESGPRQHKAERIDPRDFLGTSPKFDWE